ncbi:zinc-ribbon domain-containing protein [Lacrimispora sp. NSJ-141]|uniref:Zinc-ribbon domain-containing protein n=1 Tax=Lientehia hominis TaxID=2897778 RepID=A0AAP2RLL5_9FIRM|nr:zinc-ribbon domain-containing protein [Lientehia hominis]MCD2493358.1 zinc-ribbon domain-containing protein [Lientehia hominis]
MFCSNCGQKLNENDKFCENCGNPVYQEPEDSIPNLEKEIMKNMEDELIFEIPAGAQSHPENPHREGPRTGGAYGQAGAGPQPGNTYDHLGGRSEEPPAYGSMPGVHKKQPEKKKSRLWIIILAAVAAALLIGAAVLFFMVSGPVSKLKASVRDRDWTRAEALYEKNFAGKDRREQQAAGILGDAVQEIQSEFISETTDYQTARRYLKAISGFWDDESVETALESIRELNDSRTAFKEAEACMEDEDYAGAIQKFSEVIKADGKYEEASARLETAKSKYKDKVLNESQAQAELNDYDTAIAQVKEALKILSGDRDLQEKLEELEDGQEKYAIQSVLDQADSYASKGNYYSALDLLRNTLKENPGNEKLSRALENYRQKYQEDILGKAQAALGSDENYDAAVVVLDGALHTLDGDYPEIEQVLREKREEYIQAQLAKSQQDNSVSSAVGNWNVTTVTTGTYEMPAGDFLMYGGMMNTQMRLEIYDTGEFYLDILGKTGEGTWSADGQENGRYILTMGTDTQPVTIDGAGKLSMELDGVLLKFEKETSA